MKRMGRPKETKKVDSKKVKEILAKNHITMAKLSQDMGFHESYVSCLLRQGELSKYAVTYLKNTYGVSYSEYKFGVEEKTVEEVQNTSDNTVVKNESQILSITSQRQTVDVSDESISKLLNNLNATLDEMINTVNHKLDEMTDVLNNMSDAVYKAVYSAVIAAWKDM